MKQVCGVVGAPAVCGRVAGHEGSHMPADTWEDAPADHGWRTDLPESSDPVLVFRYGDKSVASFIRDDDEGRPQHRWRKESGEYFAIQPTHWQPLPPDPDGV